MGEGRKRTGATRTVAGAMRPTIAPGQRSSGRHDTRAGSEAAKRSAGATRSSSTSSRRKRRSALTLPPCGSIDRQRRCAGEAPAPDRANPAIQSISIACVLRAGLRTKGSPSPIDPSKPQVPWDFPPRRWTTCRPRAIVAVIGPEARRRRVAGQRNGSIPFRGPRVRRGSRWAAGATESLGARHSPASRRARNSCPRCP